MTTAPRVSVVISMVVCGCGHIMQPDAESYTCFNAACPHRGHTVAVGVYVAGRSSKELS